MISFTTGTVYVIRYPMLGVVFGYMYLVLRGLGVQVYHLTTRQYTTVLRCRVSSASLHLHALLHYVFILASLPVLRKLHGFVCRRKGENVQKTLTNFPAISGMQHSETVIFPTQTQGLLCYWQNEHVSAETL